MEINEERLGKYKISSIAFRSLWDTVYISTIGRMILVAIGRVEILDIFKALLIMNWLAVLNKLMTIETGKLMVRRKRLRLERLIRYSIFM